MEEYVVGCSRVGSRAAAPASVRTSRTRCLSGAAKPQMFMCPFSPVEAMVRPQPSRRRGVTPERMGENAAAGRAVGRSGAAPETTGSKRAAPKQGSSDHPVKRARVRSKM
jgi:hypothetical protein